MGVANLREVSGHRTPEAVVLPLPAHRVFGVEPGRDGDRERRGRRQHFPLVPECENEAGPVSFRAQGGDHGVGIRRRRRRRWGGTVLLRDCPRGGRGLDAGIRGRGRLLNWWNVEKDVREKFGL